MRNYLRCLAEPPAGATHLCILQDDALPCNNFLPLLQEAVAERPDDVISLFVGALRNNTRKLFYEAMKRGSRWSPVYFRDIHHVVALVWPVARAQQFLDWYPTARMPGPKPPRSDDAVVGYWARRSRVQVWATVPCLVEHPDDYPSSWVPDSRRKDPGRRAIAFADNIA